MHGSYLKLCKIRRGYLFIDPLIICIYLCRLHYKKLVELLPTQVTGRFAIKIVIILSSRTFNNHLFTAPHRKTRFPGFSYASVITVILVSQTSRNSVWLAPLMGGARNWMDRSKLVCEVRRNMNALLSWCSLLFWSQWYISLQCSL